MKKLNANEILEIVEKNYSVESFGYNDLLETLEGVEIITEEQQAEALKLDKERSDYFESIKESLEGKTHKERLEHESFIKYRDMPSKWQYLQNCVLETLGLGKVVEIEQYGGEDQGSTWYSVKHFVDHDVYIKTEGYYQSYNGTEFYEGYGHEVTPQERTVTVFV